VFNLVCKDKIKFLDFKYNVQDTFMRKGQEIIDRQDYKQAVSEQDFYTIMHWTYVRKPWADLEASEADWWWKYYLKSPFSSLKDKLYYLTYTKFNKEFAQKHFCNQQKTIKNNTTFEYNNTSSLPLVSVFLPYYNDRRYLKEAIESVLNQTYPNWELILLNHATEDDCREIAHSYKDNRIVHIDMEENLGAGGGILFEKMLLASSGKYIKTFCADDVLLPHCLETLVNYMENHPEKDFAFGNLEYIDGKGKDLKANFFEKRKRFSINNDELKCIRWFARNISFLPYIGNITKREVLFDIKIDKTMVMMFDMSLWLSLLCKGYKIGYCNEIIGNYRIHEAQESSIANVNRVLRYSWFEHSVFWKIFFTIKDVEFAKRIWGQSLYKHCLKRVEDIPFFIAIETIHKQSPFMYEYLSAELEDPVKREYYKKTFGFGIKELRYLVQNDRHVIPAKTLKEKIERRIYGKCPRDLGYLDMLYLFLRKTINLLSFRTLIRKIIHKEYTM
jgi:glycosyltransferase involved in cell wall biosynthesis